MANEWHWALVGRDGGPAAQGELLRFPTQSEAESWLGEEWPVLVEAGVESVSLYEGDTLVYAGMSLRPRD
ncbi:MAG: hypothetical protein V9F82_00560 [Dermatophilaceae bacterium]